MRGVRQIERVGRIHQRLEDRARGNVGRANRRVELGPVARPTLPQLHATGVYDLERIATSRAQHPGRVLTRALPLAGGNLAEQVFVIAQQNEEPRIEDGCVVQLRMGQPSGDRRHRRIEYGGVAKARVTVAGGEGARHRAAAARSRERLAWQQVRSRRGITCMLLGEESAGQVHAAAGNVTVHVDATGHDDHSARIDDRRTCRHVRHDSATVYAHVAYFAVDAVCRVVHRSA